MCFILKDILIRGLPLIMHQEAFASVDHSLESNLYYKCYSNRAIPENQHSLYCFRSKIRNAINIIAENPNMSNVNILVRNYSRSLAPHLINVSQWHVILLQACVPLQSCSCLSPPAPWHSLGAVK